MNKTYCKGEECPVRNTCSRHTKMPKNIDYEMFINRCTRQKKYVQDESRINNDSLRH